MPTLTEAYDFVSQLPPTDRLKLGSRLIEEYAQAPTPMPYDDPRFSDEWSDEDLHDLSTFSLKYAAEAYGDEDDLECSGARDA